MEPSGEEDRTQLDVLEDAHRAAFAAFARPVSEADRRATAAVVGHSIGPTANPELARRVYEGSEGTIDLVPGRGSIACVVIRPSGESFSGATTIELAVKGGCGYITHTHSPGSPEHEELTFVGVLPAGARHLTIRTFSGSAIPVQLSPDGAYWITTRDVQDLFWTRPDGTVHQHVFGGLPMREVFRKREHGHDDEPSGEHP